MWYVVQVLNGTEDMVIEKCRHAISKELVSHIFTPRCQKLKKYAGEWTVVTEVLFRGYIFLESNADAKPLLETLSHISTLVTPVQIGGGFYPIRETEELFLRSFFDETGCIKLSVGKIVNGELLIEQGPLDGKTAWVKKIDRHKRVAEIEIMLWQVIRRIKVGLEVTSKNESEK